RAGSGWPPWAVVKAWDRHQALLGALAPHPQIVLPAAADEVRKPDLDQLTHSETSVGERPDDQLVALAPGHVLQPLDLVAREDVDDRPGQPRQLGPALHCLPLPPPPPQEMIHGPPQFPNP